MLELRVTQDTIFKQEPKQSKDLPDSKKHHVDKGSTFVLSALNITDKNLNGHIKITLANEKLNAFNTWYVFGRHAEVVKVELVYPHEEEAAQNNEKDKPPVHKMLVYLGKQLVLPVVGSVRTDQPIIPDGSFTWGEATHDGTRVPNNTNHVNNIIKLATQLERARKQIGKPFIVTSWYRPEPFNSRAGGVRNSQHLNGGAVDVTVGGISGRALGKELDWWAGGLGIYPGNRANILHLDIGVRRRWGF